LLLCCPEIPRCCGVASSLVLDVAAGVLCSGGDDGAAWWASMSKAPLPVTELREAVPILGVWLCRRFGADLAWGWSQRWGYLLGGGG
jgi:hypothetical protein